VKSGERILVVTHASQLRRSFDFEGAIGVATNNGAPRKARPSDGGCVCIFTLRLKAKPEAHPWLKLTATEVNQVWNFANATSEKAARPFDGTPQYLSAFDLDKLTAGSSRQNACIGGRRGVESTPRINSRGNSVSEYQTIVVGDVRDSRR
jgi:hypothetical protein